MRQVRPVSRGRDRHITFRNRGVLWNDARSFKLGAVGDSDPFSAATRYTLGAEVGPSETKQFTLNFTAPATPVFEGA